MFKKTILLTGASGKIGTLVRNSLCKDYNLILFCRSKINDLRKNEMYLKGDITDYREIENATQGVDIIIHMAAISGNKLLNSVKFRKDLWKVNGLGDYNVFEAARKARVSRLIYGSSHHVIGLYSAGEIIDEKVPYKPDSMYGVTKCFTESMGYLYAKKANLSVICLRIGALRDHPTEERHLAVWISPRDMKHLILCAINAPASVQYEIVYGVSNNTRKWWDISRAKSLLGYNPQDDAEKYASQVIKEPIEKWIDRVKCHGSETVDPPFMS